MIVIIAVIIVVGMLINEQHQISEANKYASRMLNEKGGK